MTKNNAAATLVAEPTERTEVAMSIGEAFFHVCAAVSNVKRTATGQVGQQKYKYATLEDVLDMVNPLLAQNGLALAQYVDGDSLRATLFSKWGEQIQLGGYNLGAIGKHQERGSAITYGRRYQICSIFGITQEDDDGAAASKGNPPTNGEKTAQAEFGTAAEFKKYYNDTIGYIEGMVAKDQAVAIRKRIERIGKVDEQFKMNAEEKLDMKLDELHLHG